MSNKFQVPSSLTLEPNPFEQSFGGKRSNGQEPQTDQDRGSSQQQRLPGVQGLTSPAPLLAASGQWQQGSRLSPAIMAGQDQLPGSFQPGMPSPAVLLGSAPGVPTGVPPRAPLQATSHQSDEADFKVSKKSNSKRSSKSKQEPEENKKRTLFLERNRIAAVKCRQRKKQWVDDLRSKVDFYQSANEELAGEVSRLKSQLDQVKQYVYSVQDPRRIPPQILSVLESTNGPPPPPSQQQQQQPLQPPQPPQAPSRVQQQQQGDYQNVVLMVPQQVMMPGSRPA